MLGEDEETVKNKDKKKDQEPDKDDGAGGDMSKNAEFYPNLSGG